MKRFKEIIIAVDSHKGYEKAVTCKDFFISHGIKTTIHYCKISHKGCILEDISDDTLLICLLYHTLLDKTGKKIPKEKITLKTRLQLGIKFRNTPFLLGIMYRNYIAVSMFLIETAKLPHHPLPIIMHELIHFERSDNSHCQNKCLGNGYLVYPLCQECNQLFEEVLKTRFEQD